MHLGRWLKPGQRLLIELNDSNLPQNDPNPQQRKEEMEHMREMYQYGQSAPDLPVQVGVATSNVVFMKFFRIFRKNSIFRKFHVSRTSNFFKKIDFGN